jgi:serine/threonine protein kinase
VKPCCHLDAAAAAARCGASSLAAMGAEPRDVGLNDLSLEYSYADLQQATRNFDANCQIGHGSFGGVYRGIQRDGTEVAIKALDVPEESGFEEEVRVLSKFRHPNLVILMGFARESSRRFLVYELLAGGDVYRRLQKSCLENVTFSWRQRISVAFDAACGLSHLHHASPKVFHRDIKSPNILLDRNGTAKMADFGLACLSQSSAHKVKQASGTVGYACPLYVQRGVVDEGSEVYSFGIVMLELLTASPPAYVSQGKDGSQQYQFLVTHLNGDVRVALNMADPKAQWPQQVGMDFATLALRAITMTEEHRPGFAHIVNELRGLRDLPDPHGTQSMPSLVPTQVVSGMSSGSRYHEHNRVFGSSMTNGQGGHHAGGQVLLGVSAAGVPVLAQQSTQPHRHLLVQQPAAVVYQHQQMMMDSPWSVTQTFRVCGVGEESVFLGQARLLDRHTITSVSMAVEHLNYGMLSCPEGFCIVWSASNRFYYILFRPELKDFAYSKFKSRDEESLDAAVMMQHKIDAMKLDALMGVGPVISHARSLLWTLECIYSEGTSLQGLAQEQRSLMHCQEPGAAGIKDLRVGRLFQEEFLATVVQDEQNRSQLSREHFQIWAVAEDPGSPSKPGQEPIPCCFFLTNVNVNGTIVNGQHVHSTNEQVPLHDGDLIALPRIDRQPGSDTVKLTPWLQFRFDLSRSILKDGDPVQRSEEAEVANDPWLTWFPQRSSNSDASRGTGLEYTEFHEKHGSEPACLGTSFVGVGMTPLFVLEVGGPAVRQGAASELRRIVHGAPIHVEESGEWCPPLLLGRGQQSGFWQRLLIEEAYNSLSRQHLQIEVCSGSGSVKENSEDVEFNVRNLSDLNPIRVCARAEDGFDACPALAQGEKRRLRHGDTIVVNPSKEHMLFLVFEHLSSGKLEVASVGTSGIHKPEGR